MPFLLRRLAACGFTVGAALLLTFALLVAAPGDPIATLIGSSELSPDAIAQLRRVYALDAPPVERFLRWVSALGRGDLGWSITRQQPVADVLRTALPNSLLLCGLAVVGSVLLGTALGAWQGAHLGSRRDRVSSLGALALFAVPEFVLALLLLLVFAWQLHWLPASGVRSDLARYLPLGARLWDRLTHLVLPVTALSLVGAAVFSRHQRHAMGAAIRERFVLAARARGASARRAAVRHAWRAALLPVVSLIGLYLPALVGGAFFVERVFAWPGMGMALADAVLARDYPVVLGIVAVGSAVTALGALVTDLLASRVDPRLRHD